MDAIPHQSTNSCRKSVDFAVQKKIDYHWYHGLLSLARKTKRKAMEGSN